MSLQVLAKQARHLGIIAACFLVACSSPEPKDQSNICHVFRVYPSWYWAAKASRKKWGVPISVQMAIIHQESHFQADAKPPRKKLLGVMPWVHASTAQGYAQALNETWQSYLHATDQNRASRTNFKVATDFVGWFVYHAHRDLGISRNNAYELYLAYHEGEVGYHDRSYRYKPWLRHIAYQVSYTAMRYRYQLLRCEAHLPQKPWWDI